MDFSYEKCHLWMGELLPHMDDNYLYKLFLGLGKPLAGLRIMRNNLTNDPMHGFLQFKSVKDALDILYTHDNKPIPNEQPDVLFYLDVANESMKDTRPYFGVWVGNLLHTTKTADIKKAFTENGFPPIRVMISKDRLGMSKGYAFIQLSSEWEQKTAIFNMNNYMGLGGSAPLLVRDAKKKNGQQYNSDDCFSIKIFFLKIRESEKEINEYFESNFPSFRFISSPRFPNKKSKGYSIVKFGSEEDQLKAIKMLNGQQIFSGDQYLKVQNLSLQFNDKFERNHFGGNHFKRFGYELKNDSYEGRYSSLGGGLSEIDMDNLDFDYFDDNLYMEVKNELAKRRTVTEDEIILDEGEKKPEQLINSFDVEMKKGAIKGEAAFSKEEQQKMDIGCEETIKNGFNSKNGYNTKYDIENKLPGKYDETSFSDSLKNSDTKSLKKVGSFDIIKKNINRFVPENIILDNLTNSFDVDSLDLETKAFLLGKPKVDSVAMELKDADGTEVVDISIVSKFFSLLNAIQIFLWNIFFTTWN
ncbi:polyadenylate-binding protein RBP45B-like [Teleopsis dalmanni]|uniref:polyadenylate-binding protein RBP45B-like n=1 Tax=Teleopsis dalmanni TaxID=139649 RepID=UPI0018CDD0FB|nr:polyadenylate-binding protein RBP45B-like [Teleopsis dalmanni]